MKLNTFIFPSLPYYNLFKKYIQMDSGHFDDDNLAICIEDSSFEMEVAIKVFKATQMERCLMAG